MLTYTQHKTLVQNGLERRRDLYTHTTETQRQVSAHHSTHTQLYIYICKVTHKTLAQFFLASCQHQSAATSSTKVPPHHNRPGKWISSRNSSHHSAETSRLPAVRNGKRRGVGWEETRHAKTWPREGKGREATSSSSSSSSSRWWKKQKGVNGRGRGKQASAASRCMQALPVLVSPRRDVVASSSTSTATAIYGERKYKRNAGTTRAPSLPLSHLILLLAEIGGHGEGLSPSGLW